jgi:hypothetical protein
MNLLPQNIVKILHWANTYGESGGEWNDAFDDEPCTIRGTVAPKAALFITKQPCFWWLTDQLPDEWEIYFRAWPVGEWLGKIVNQSAASKFRFWGDADPLDMLSFASLAACLPTGSSIECWTAARWLESSLRCPSALPLAHLTIELTEFEKELWLQLNHLPIEWSKVCPQTVKLLDSGKKLELDGVTNPAIYGHEHCRALGIELFSESVK